MDNLEKLPAILDTVKYPADLRSFSIPELKQLAEDLRRETISAVSQTGGHLGAGLGVVELTVALHHVFNTPDDKIIWDVGHQAYPHKILTGRRDRIRTIRQPEGLAGFTRRAESIYDCFGAGHSSTSISAALGMAVARDLKGDNFEVVAVIGDGALSAGMAYEALNNAGHLGTRLIIILNDNDMSIAPPTGAMSAYLSRLISSHSYRGLRHLGKVLASKFPEPLARAAKKAERYARGMATGGTFFEEMGIYYVGPVDGHNLDALLPVLKNISSEKNSGPVLLHVVTQKGYGYKPAENSVDKYHGVGKFCVDTGVQNKEAANAPTYTKVFAEALIKQAEADDKVVAITAAMPGGTGLDLFGNRFPSRTFDVGIAEQHAVTFAAGLACEGFKPYVAIYSTFLQRAYDQVVHDVAIQSLPVRFCMDRAGLVGADGPTHAGSYDVTYLATLPNMIVMAAADECELARMIATMNIINDKPSALRYPRGEGFGVEIPQAPEPLVIGKGRVVSGENHGDVALISYGTRLHECMKAASLLEQEHGITCTVIDARFCKPLDEELLAHAAINHKAMITVEEGAIGGFGSHVAQYLSSHGFMDSDLKFRSLFLPDEFIEQNKPYEMYNQAGLNAAQIVEHVLGLQIQDDSLTFRTSVRS